MAAPRTGIYRDRTESIARRVDDLLAQMTLAEKVGQLNIPIPLPKQYFELMGEHGPSDLQQALEFVEGSFYARVGPGSGFWGPLSVMAGVAIIPPEKITPSRMAEVMNKLQREAAETRLGIPLMNVIEGVHGLAAPGATMFPEGPALGSSWDPELIGRCFGVAAVEARALGFHVLSTIVAEPIRDPRLGRNVEGFSECPFLTSCLITSITRHVQDHADDRLRAIAQLTVFPGQTEPTSGLERGAMEVSERRLREIFYPPFEAGIAAGAFGVMAAYPAVDGDVPHGSERLLTTALRDELGFVGVVYSEGRGLYTLVDERICRGPQEVAAKAIQAGVDVNITAEGAYLDTLVELVESGQVSEALLDRSVRRVLESKFRLGLFDNALTDPADAERTVHCPEHVELAREAAVQGCVLLKNEDILPLRPDGLRIALLGPNADDIPNQLGDYVTGHLLNEVVTVKSALDRRLSGRAEIHHLRGCEVIGGEDAEIAPAVELARECDLAIIVLGEQCGDIIEGGENRPLTIGERHDSAKLELTGFQQQLLERVHATGTPVALVLINGRPLALPWAAEHVPAILEAWIPGERGGDAIVDILLGDREPGGRLPVSVPRHAGQLPVTYDYKPGKAQWLQEGGGYVDLPATPLYPFGHGLTFTRFEYRDLVASTPGTADGAPIEVSVEIANAGPRRGTEVVQVYVRDVLASVTQPDKRLAAFTKVTLDPGEARRLKLPIAERQLEILTAQMQWKIEPGEFEILVGASSEDIRLSTAVSLN